MLNSFYLTGMKLSFLFLFFIISFSSCKKDGNTIFPNTAAIENTNPLNWCEADTIICYGDSFTYGPGAISYPSQLSQLLGKPVINAGISGENAQQILNRVLADSIHKNNPHVFWAGRNDNWAGRNDNWGDTAMIIGVIPRRLLRKYLKWFLHFQQMNL